jgi:hypothetical protein
VERLECTLRIRTNLHDDLLTKHRTLRRMNPNLRPFRIRLRNPSSHHMSWRDFSDRRATTMK